MHGVVPTAIGPREDFQRKLEKFFFEFASLSNFQQLSRLPPTRNVLAHQ